MREAAEAGIADIALGRYRSFDEAGVAREAVRLKRSAGVCRQIDAGFETGGRAFSDSSSLIQGNLSHHFQAISPQSHEFSGVIR